MMLKTIAIGATAVTLLASAAAYSQQPIRPDIRQGQHRTFSPEDRAAFLDARVAALHAGLHLSAEQDKAWPAFEQAYRGLAGLRHHRQDGAGAPGAAATVDPIQRAQRTADALAARSVALKHYADAAAPLYQGLDDSQKRRFAILARSHRPHFHHFAFSRFQRGDRAESYAPR
jgi:hypothetical protein